ncbi:MAG: right-handed parallel beta-helix repeat-containing protein, partial [bacterium]
TYTNCTPPCHPYKVRTDSFDFFNDQWNNAFTPYTNPNSNGYVQDGYYWKQTAHTGISIANIRAGTCDTMLVDIHFDTPRDTIVHDTDWAKWVILGGDLVVGSGAALSISPGATISFVPGADHESSGVDTAKCELVAYGDIAAEGNETGTILFRPAGIARGYDPAPGDWYGIRVAQLDTVRSVFDYCDVGYGTKGIEYFYAGSGMNADLGYVKRSEIHDNSVVGIGYAWAGWSDFGGLVEDCDVYDNGGTNGYGIAAARGGLTIASNEITDNGQYGVSLTYATGGLIRDNTIDQSGRPESVDTYGFAFDVVDTCSQFDVIHNHIEGCSKEGIHVGYDADYPCTKIRCDSNTAEHCSRGFAVYDTSIPGGEPSPGDSVIMKGNIFRYDSVAVAVLCEDSGVVLGDRSKGLGRYNSIYGDTVFVWVPGLGRTKAEKNWWGSVPPDSNKFIGDVDYVPYLTLDPSGQGQIDPSGRPRGDGTPVGGVRFSLGQNPAGANPEVVLSVSRKASARLSIYDVNGRLVAGLMDGTLEPGIHLIVWDGLDSEGKTAPAGVYFCRFESEDGVSTAKIVMLK